MMNAVSMRDRNRQPRLDSGFAGTRPSPALLLERHFLFHEVTPMNKRKKQSDVDVIYPEDELELFEQFEVFEPSLPD